MGTITVVVGPTSLPPGDSEVLRAIRTEAQLEYLCSWDHEPTDQEKDDATIRMPIVIHEELELTDVESRPHRRRAAPPRKVRRTDL